MRCARITYVGELGYELHLPVEHVTHVYDVLHRMTASTGTPSVGSESRLQLSNAGLYALGSLRMEKVALSHMILWAATNLMSARVAHS